MLGKIYVLWKGFQDIHLGEIQDQIEITPEELIEEDLSGDGSF